MEISLHFEKRCDCLPFCTYLSGLQAWGILYETAEFLLLCFVSYSNKLSCFQSYTAWYHCDIYRGATYAKDQRSALEA